jgi:zinc transport system substrate-binding protein
MLKPCFLAAALIAGLSFDAAAAVPDVVASIKPLHSLAARLMQGVAEPKLLVDGAASLHSFSLKPSQARALEEAELVLWAGPALETFLHDPLEALAQDALIVEAMALPGMLLLAPREGGAWEGHGDHEDEQDHDHEGAVDGHLFLDPANAMTLAAALAAALVELDPDHAAAYSANAAALQAELEALDREVTEMLAPVRERPFVVFHDAYQYFERRYDLAALGSITVSPEQPPGARRLAEIRDRIEALGALCVFAEPGFEPALVETVLAGTGARSGVLDPEGIALDPGPALYGSLMRGLAQSLRECLLPRD